MDKNKFTLALNKATLKLKKYSPEILAAVGVVGVVSSAVMACKATTELDKILSESKTSIDTIHEASEGTLDLNGKTYTKEDEQKDLAIVYAQTGLKLVKLYLPAVVLGTLSLTSIITSNNILRKRNMALSAAYYAVDKGFKDYRNNVIDRFGKEVDKELKYNIKAQTIEKTIINEKTGKEKKVKETLNVIQRECSEYARFFDESNPNWEKESDFNLLFLKSQQNAANDLLKAKGFVFLNDVYRLLGLEETKAGQVVGWRYDSENPNGDNYIDFGIYDGYSWANRRFVNGYEDVILLDFNVDGNIWDLM